MVNISHQVHQHGAEYFWEEEGAIEELANECESSFKTENKGIAHQYYEFLNKEVHFMPHLFRMRNWTTI